MGYDNRGPEEREEVSFHFFWQEQIPTSIAYVNDKSMHQSQKREVTLQVAWVMKLQMMEQNQI